MGVKVNNAPTSPSAGHPVSPEEQSNTQAPTVATCDDPTPVFFVWKGEEHGAPLGAEINIGRAWIRPLNG